MTGMLRIVGLLIGMYPFLIWGQTCCSGGVPLAGNLGLPMGETGQLQIGASYDLNRLRTLKTGTRTLEDQSRLRTTQSILFTAGYTISARWSAELLLPWVRQERTIEQRGNRDFTYTQGIGDGVVLVKYLITALGHPSHSLQVGLGLKAPTGNPDKTRPDGIPLILDLQPGSGSWDGLLWSRYAYNLGARPSMTLSATATLTRRGTYRAYLGELDYRIGDDLNLLLSLTDRMTLGSLQLDPALSLRLRHAGKDANEGLSQENTGGTFVYGMPGLALSLSPAISVQANLEIPLYNHPGGTQLVPSLRAHAGIYATLNTRGAALMRRPQP